MKVSLFSHLCCEQTPTMSEHADHSGSRSRSPPATRASRTEGTDSRHTSSEAERINHGLISPFVGWRWVPRRVWQFRQRMELKATMPVQQVGLQCPHLHLQGVAWSMSDILGGGTMFSIPPVEEMDTCGVPPSAGFPGSYSPCLSQRRQVLQL